MNGEFYKCPASGLEIVQRVAKLREFRETEIYLIILATMNKVLAGIWGNKKQRKLYSDAVLLRQTRPWGLDGEMMNVWVLALSCLLKDTPKNKIVKKDRPSVYSLIEDALPPMPFPFSVDLLKDALRLYVSPYGQVADTESVTYPECDCIGGPKNKPLRHDPCSKASVALCLSVYVDEEVSCFLFVVCCVCCVLFVVCFAVCSPLPSHPSPPLPLTPPIPPTPRLTVARQSLTSSPWPGTTSRAISSFSC